MSLTLFLLSFAMYGISMNVGIGAYKARGANLITEQTRVLLVLLQVSLLIGGIVSFVGAEIL